MKRLVTSVMAGLVGIHSLTVAADSRPRLLVGIIVDQLRTDYIETLQDKFGTGGFRKLIENGVYLKDLDFKVPLPDAASATAILQTGSYPRQNGITSTEIYNPSEKKAGSVLYDPAYIGNFTTDTYSPSALRVTTLTDEIALESNGKSQIHSIAPNPEEAIILSGHAGNSAFWISDETGKWSSTTYYPSQPATLQTKNYNTPLVSRLDTMKWVPFKDLSYYPDIASSTKKDGFKYTFPRSDKDVFKLYKNSPYVNADVTEAATEYIRTLNLGKNNEATDVLNVAYSLAPYPAIKKGDGKFELEDAYLRLDKDLERLLKEIDAYVGLENTLVYVASTGYATEPERAASDFRLPGGTFSVKRALSLLNSYLAAKYGNGTYVDQFYAGHIYLDKPALEERGLDISRVAEDARDFLVRVSGVADAYTIPDLQSPAVAQLEGHRLANDPKTAGEIVMEFNPGWKVIDDTRYPPQTLPDITTAYLTPAIIMGTGIKPGVVEHTVDATAIAPTVARTLRIRSPNATSSKPLLLEKTKNK